MQHVVPNTVGFQAAFPEDTNPPEPPGRIIAEFLSERLRGSGYAVRDFDQYEDVGWSFHCVVDGKLFLVLVYAEPETSGSAWLITTHTNSALELGFLADLLGKRHEAQHRTLNQAIEQILSTDERFSQVRWETQP